MSKKRWEDETLKPTLEKYPERKETLLDERDILNTPEDVNDSEIELPPTIDLGFNIFKSKSDGSNIFSELLEMILTFPVRDTSS